VLRRLAGERIIWLTTVTPDGQPVPSPVWFIWEGDSFLIYTRPNTVKLRNIATNPRVSLNLDGDHTGGAIVIVSGEAAVDGTAVAADEHVQYSARYSDGFNRLRMTPEQFAQRYSVAIRVRPTGYRAY
jgi:PPOX class probable F420-dependent enzyme